MPKKSNTETDISKLYIAYSRVKRKILAKHTKQVRILLILFVVISVGSFLFATSQILKENYFVKVANAFLFTPDGYIDQFEGRTNVLLLGKADGDINTPYLTDTMIFASIKHEDPQSMTLISIPRDIWVPEIEDKINAAYHVGEQKRTGGGLSLAKTSVEKVVGQPIHYAISIDTSRLVQAVDILDGIDVNVKNSFTDNQFPTPGRENDDCGLDQPLQEGIEYPCRYETISFQAGLIHMDGQMALKFARSRHAEEEIERTDFARAARQQLVLEAMQNKLFSTQTLSSYSKLQSLYKLGREGMETDLVDYQLALLSRKIIQSKNNAGQHVLPEELLETPPLSETYNFLYILTPNKGSKEWSEVHFWVEGVL